jgi:hypothetical protein
MNDGAETSAIAIMLRNNALRSNLERERESERITERSGKVIHLEGEGVRNYSSGFEGS